MIFFWNDSDLRGEADGGVGVVTISFCILTTACFHEYNFAQVGWRSCFASAESLCFSSTDILSF